MKDLASGAAGGPCDSITVSYILRAARPLVDYNVPRELLSACQPVSVSLVSRPVSAAP
jgi:hypothetical protein